MTSTQSRKHRGYATQRIVAETLRRDGFPYAEPTGAGRQGTDVTGTPGIVWEVKARTLFDPMAAMRQASTHIKAGELPITVLRCNGQGEAAVDSWPTLVPFGVLRRLLREAGYGNPLAPPSDEGRDPLPGGATNITEE
jgi:hypothetical protein